MQEKPWTNPQKGRRGLQRLLHAAAHSMRGLKAAWHEPAFRQETMLAAVLLPLALWLGRGWVEVSLLAGSVLLVLIVELLNTGLETAIDRIGTEFNELSGRAKDMGSAAVLVSLVTCAGVWFGAICNRILG